MKRGEIKRRSTNEQVAKRKPQMQKVKKEKCFLLSFVCKVA